MPHLHWFLNMTNWNTNHNSNSFEFTFTFGCLYFLFRHIIRNPNNSNSYLQFRNKPKTGDLHTDNNQSPLLSIFKTDQNEKSDYRRSDVFKILNCTHFWMKVIFSWVAFYSNKNCKKWFEHCFESSARLWGLRCLQLIGSGYVKVTLADCFNMADVKLQLYKDTQPGQWSNFKSCLGSMLSHPMYETQAQLLWCRSQKIFQCEFVNTLNPFSSGLCWYVRLLTALWYTIDITSINATILVYCNTAIHIVLWHEAL